MIIKCEGLTVQFRREAIFPIGDGTTGGFRRSRPGTVSGALLRLKDGEIEPNRILSAKGQTEAHTFAV